VSLGYPPRIVRLFAQIGRDILAEGQRGFASATLRKRSTKDSIVEPDDAALRLRRFDVEPSYERGRRGRPAKEANQREGGRGGTKSRTHHPKLRFDGGSRQFRRESVLEGEGK
jgi:hypothetical protein